MTINRQTKEEWVMLALEQNSKTAVGCPTSIDLAHLLAGILEEEQSRMSKGNKATLFAMLRIELAKFARETEHLFTTQGA